MKRFKKERFRKDAFKIRVGVTKKNEDKIVTFTFWKSEMGKLVGSFGKFPWSEVKKTLNCL